MVIDIWVCCCTWTCFYLVDSSQREKGIQSESDVNDFQEEKERIMILLFSLKNLFLCASVFFPTPRAVCMLTSKRVDLKCQGGIEKKEDRNSLAEAPFSPSSHPWSLSHLFIFPPSRILCSCFLSSPLPISWSLFPFLFTTFVKETTEECKLNKLNLMDSEGLAGMRTWLLLYLPHSDVASSFFLLFACWSERTRWSRTVRPLRTKKRWGERRRIMLSLSYTLQFLEGKARKIRRG